MLRNARLVACVAIYSYKSNCEFHLTQDQPVPESGHPNRNRAARVVLDRYSARLNVAHVRMEGIFFFWSIPMRRLLITAGLAVLLAIAMQLSAQTAQDTTSYHTLNHGEIGVYGDMYRIAPSGASAVNFLGLGGRAGFNVGTHTALEAEMNYDFEKNYTNITVNNGNGSGSTTTYTATVRPITGLFGPKFQFGTSSAFRAFIEAKGGFIDFTTNCNAPAGSGSCFTNSLAAFGGSSSHFAGFPGGGIEFFAGPIGLRIEAGDEVWVNNGNAYNNLRVTFSPTIRF